MGISSVPTYAEELGLDLRRPEDRFKWLIASVLFAKRISAKIAAQTFKRFEEEGLTTPSEILRAGWNRLVEVLDSGGYVRYDHSTASNLLELCREILEEYGTLEDLHASSKNPEELERRLETLRGVGPTCVNIFLRELRGIWKNASPAMCEIARKMALKLKMSEMDAMRNESRLVRVFLEYCKKGKCTICPVRESCTYCTEK